MKRATVIIALVMGSMMLTTPAMADEPVAEVTTEQAAPTPEPEVVPEPAPEPEAKVATKTKPPKDDHKESVCHPVNGKGELGNGWNLIPPDKHSSHIDDEGNGKHTSNDGRTDIISVDGTCPDPDPGPQPDDVVQKRKVVGEPDCEAGTVTTLKQERTKTYTLIDNVWVLGDWSEWVTVKELVDDVTPEQCPPPPPHDECPLIDGDQPEGTDCDPEVPPTEEPPAEEPPTVEPPAAEPPATTALLPNTGADSNLAALGLLALAALVMGGGALVASRK